ncbi:MAG: hypothetical protein IH586_00770 [Anaerolineaceae bacterium]|nr:hypothetical protein [Anaerolineaceae bacterium]
MGLTPQGTNTPSHMVFLFSDTGGGHRSAAQAICEAIQQEYPGQASLEMVDIFRGYAPPLLARKPRLLGLIFHLSSGIRRTEQK